MKPSISTLFLTLLIGYPSPHGLRAAAKATAPKASPKSAKAAPKPKGGAPVPPARPSYHPVTPMQGALAAMSQVVRAVRKSVGKKDLASVHNEDMRLYSALTVLNTQGVPADSADKNALIAGLTELGRKVGALHAAADAFDQSKSEALLAEVEAEFSRVEGFFRAADLRAARAYADSWTCPMHPDVAGRKGGLCPKCGMALDQPFRINLFLPPGARPAPLVRAKVRTESPLAVGVPARAVLTLMKEDGSPVPLDDLIETHTRKVHLLIIDMSLTDYHHEHPEPTANPGEYAFRFTPQKPGPYRAFADLRPAATGLQEYAMTNLYAATSGEALSQKTEALEAVRDGLRYALTFGETPVRAGRAVPVRLRITGPGGAPVRKLEPVMGAFAHFVAFNEDRWTVLHLHPLGPPLTDPRARGGPELRFQFYTDRPGFYRLFVQVKIDGRDVFVPFGVTVKP